MRANVVGPIIPPTLLINLTWGEDRHTIYTAVRCATSLPVQVSVQNSNWPPNPRHLQDSGNWLQSFFILPILDFVFNLSWRFQFNIRVGTAGGWERAWGLFPPRYTGAYVPNASLLRTPYKDPFCIGKTYHLSVSIQVFYLCSWF